MKFPVNFSNTFCVHFALVSPPCLVFLNRDYCIAIQPNIIVRIHKPCALCFDSVHVSIAVWPIRWEIKPQVLWLLQLGLFISLLIGPPSRHRNTPEIFLVVTLSNPTWLWRFFFCPNLHPSPSNHISVVDEIIKKKPLSTVKCVRDPTGFHADKLHKALQDGDTKTVARIILNKNKVSNTPLRLHNSFAFCIFGFNLRSCGTFCTLHDRGVCSERARTLSIRLYLNASKLTLWSSKFSATRKQFNSSRFQSLISSLKEKKETLSKAWKF